MSYEEFIQKKLQRELVTSFTDVPWLPSRMFDHQRALVTWALRRGKAAVFADTGLGKTIIELVWAQNVSDLLHMPVLILVPLAVAAQVKKEAETLGLRVTLCKSQSDVKKGLNVTNYDRLHLFDHEKFGGVVLDESSVIKHHDSATFQNLIESFAKTRFKLAATATPAPNDYTELGTHAQFLGVCSSQEMLSEFFVHDGGDTSKWRLKRHAVKPFWNWVSTWGALIRSPEDLGFDGSAYVLPSLHINQVSVQTAQDGNGQFFPSLAQTLSERRSARKNSINERVMACAAEANACNDSYLIWCELNSESKMLVEAIPDAIEVTGSDTPEIKEERLLGFASGKYRVLVTKPSIAGWGLNWQHCNRIGFVGVIDSYEAYYQAIRRCWRFGQRREVFVSLFVSEAEGAVAANLARKQKDAKMMADELSSVAADAVMFEVTGTKRSTNLYQAEKKIQSPTFI